MRFPATITMAAALAAAGAAPAAAQIGAIGGAPGGAASGAEATARAPIFSESALVLPKGAWTASAFMGVTSGGFSSIDYTFTQLLLGAFYAPSDRLVIGATLFPYASVSVETPLGDAEDSGRGDATAYAKYQVWNSADDRTSLAGVGTLGLPLGDDDFGSEGIDIGLAGVVSHSAQQVTLHGALGVAVPTDDADGETTLIFSAAAVHATRPNLSLGVELFGATASIADERYTSIELAPGARLRLGQNVFLNGGVQFNVSTSLGESPYDYAVLLGASFTR